MNRLLKNDESLATELDDEDLLDIDGSDDPTTAFSGKAVMAKLAARKKAQQKLSFQPRQPVDDATMVFNSRSPGDVGSDSEDGDRATIPVPMKLEMFKSPAVLVGAPTSGPTAEAFARKSPTISPVPSVRAKRNANSSYPPIAINVGAGPVRPQAMSFISERPSRAGWIVAAVMGVLILVGGSIKVAQPKAAAAPPAAVVATEPPPAETPEEPKVVTFGDSQGIAIKPKAEAPKTEAPKAEAKKPAPAAPHPVTVKPVVKPGKVDDRLAVSKDKDKEDKMPATSHDNAKDAKPITAEQKKLKSIEQDLADLQLKAASR